MWISVLKSEITGKRSKKLPKNAKNNNQLKIKRILNAKVLAKWEPGFYI